ncbi:MAG: TolC family protein [Pirellulaceae bacterium]
MTYPMLAFCLLTQAAGCARNYTVYPGAWSAAVGPTSSAETLPEAETTSIDVDVSRVPPSADLETTDPPPPSENTHLALTAAECQCMAAANAPLANLSALDMPLASLSRSNNKASIRASSAKSDLLALRALEERNRAAGEALEMYYQLFEAEAGKDAVDRSLAQLGEVLRSVESLRAKGLKVDVDLDELRTRRIELLDKQAEARLAVERLNSGLRAMLGVSSGERRKFWPTEPLTVSADRIDIDAAVAEGLATRADLALLRLLTTTLSAETLPMVQSALQQAGLAGQGATRRLWAPLARLLGSTRQSIELGTRSQQLQQMAVDGERAAAEEIRSAAQTVDIRLEQVALAKETLDSQRRRLDTLLKKRDLGSATPIEVLMQRMTIIEAENDLVRRVVAWEIAMVKLKQSQGMLVVECGGAGGLGGAFGLSGAYCHECETGEGPEGLEMLPMPDGAFAR